MGMDREEILSALEASQMRRAVQQREMQEACHSGTFSRSVVTIESPNAAGSATVVGEENGSYILMTVSHVVEGATHVVVRSSPPDRKLIGTASVVIKRRDSDGPDLALLAISANDVQGGRLVPVRMLTSNP